MLKIFYRIYRENFLEFYKQKEKLYVDNKTSLDLTGGQPVAEKSFRVQRFPTLQLKDLLSESNKICNV